MELQIEEFEARWKSVFDAVYSGEAATEEPFRNKAWRTLPLGFSPNLMPADFELIDPILGPSSDGCFLLSQEKIAANRELPLELPWSRHSFVFEAANTVIPHFDDFRATPRSGAWGWCCSNEELSVLGAPPSTISALLEALGGAEAARQRFFESVSDFVLPEFVRGIAKHGGWATEE